MSILGLYVISLIGITMQQYIMLKLFSCILKPRYDGRLIVFILTLGNMLQIYLKTIILKNALAMYGMYFVFMTLILILLFYGKWYEKIMAFFLNGLSSVIAEIVCMQVGFGYLGFDTQAVTSGICPESVFLNILGLVVSAIVAYMIIIVQKPVRYVMFGKNMMPIWIIFLLQFVVTFIYCGLMMHYHLRTYWMFWIYLFLAILVDLYIIQIMGELEVRQESLKKLEFEQQREENVRIYYQNLVLKLKNVSELKEEYEKKLRNIYDELNIEYKPQVSSTETGIMENDEHFQAFCVSTVVSGIIDKKKKELDKLQYPYELHIEFQDDWKIEMMDISRLLNNMLDNAMDAVANYLEETQNKGRLKGNYIFGISYIEDDFLTIEIKNIKSPNQNLVEKDGKYISSKKKKEGHGYGLQIIGRIAAKYDGKMEISESEEYFINKVILKIK